jgi:hypothetical protein
MIGLYMAILIMSFVMIKADYARNLRVSEAKSAAIMLGESRVVDSVKTGNSIFSAVFNDSGLINWSYETANANRNNQAPLFRGDKVSESMQSSTDTIWEMCRLIVQRMVFVFYWFPVLIPFIIAATVDGSMAREIRKWRFQFTSTTMYNNARKSAGLIVFCLLLLPVIPIKMPILIYPAAILTCTLMVWISLANMQKRI